MDVFPAPTPFSRNYVVLSNMWYVCQNNTDSKGNQHMLKEVIAAHIKYRQSSFLGDVTRRG